MKRCFLYSETLHCFENSLNGTIDRRFYTTSHLFLQRFKGKGRNNKRDIPKDSLLFFLVEITSKKKCDSLTRQTIFHTLKICSFVILCKVLPDLCSLPNKIFKHGITQPGIAIFDKGILESQELVISKETLKYSLAALNRKSS